MIALYGSTGFTGRLVAEELAARGAAFLLAGRDRAKLDTLAAALPARRETRVASADDAEALERLAGEAKVVINCAGPFTHTGLGVLRACLARGAHYLDSTGEQRFMMQVRQTAAGARVAVISGAGFEYTVSDLHLPLSTAGMSRIDMIDVGYALGAGTSVGTRLSIVESLKASRWAYVDGRFVDRGLQVETRRMDSGRGRASRMSSFPGGEVLHAPITVPGARTVRTWIAGLPPPRIQHAAALVMRLPALSALAQRIVRRGGAPDAGARDKSRFTILHEVRGEAGGKPAMRRLLIRGTDPYGLTAKLLAEMAERLLRGEARRTGFTSPAATFETESFRADLREVGDDLLELPEGASAR